MNQEDRQSTHERRFDPKQLERLDAPERRTWLPPDEVIAALELAPGMYVADIGAGTGYFALPIAATVAPGHVFAVDVAPEMLEHLGRKLEAQKISTVELVRAEAPRTPMLDGECDLVFYSTVWHEIEEHGAALAEAARLLEKGGRIAIVDWRPDVTRPPGPPLEHRLAPSEVERQLQHRRWRDIRTRNIGTYTYLVTAARP